MGRGARVRTAAQAVASSSSPSPPSRARAGCPGPRAALRAGAPAAGAARASPGRARRRPCGTRSAGERGVPRVADRVGVALRRHDAVASEMIRWMTASVAVGGTNTMTSPTRSELVGTACVTATSPGERVGRMEPLSTVWKCRSLDVNGDADRQHEHAAAATIRRVRRRVRRVSVSGVQCGPSSSARPHRASGPTGPSPAPPPPTPRPWRGEDRRQPYVYGIAVLNRPPSITVASPGTPPSVRVRSRLRNRASVRGTRIQ